MKTKRQPIRQRRKGQSQIEFAFGALLLVLLLAAAVDFGRAFYTYVIVQQMAGEAAAVLAQEPDRDFTVANHGLDNDTFQYRARNVAARDMGMIIDPTHAVRIDSNNANSDVRYDVARTDRCPGTQFTVSVTYHMDDLFFPAFLGMSSISIGASEQAAFSSATAYRTPPCPTPTSLP